MYGAPGLEYGGHIETANPLSENKIGENKIGVTEKTSNLNHPEYLCYFPTIFYRRACDECCQYKDEAKCSHNGWDWAARAAELRVEREREKEKEKAAAGKGKSKDQGPEEENKKAEGDSQ